MGVFISIDLVPNVKMTSSTSSSGSDCSKYDCKIESGRVAKYDYDVKDSGSKSCAGKVAAADLTQYVWDYKNDENKDLGLEVGAVVHNREWSYGLIKYASLVQIAVSFKARCTWAFRDEGATRTLRIVDDTGYTHGELDINIHAGTPCVCAVPRKEKIAVKDKVIRCPQKLSQKSAGNCGGRVEMVATGGVSKRGWSVRAIEGNHRAEHKRIVDAYWKKNPSMTVSEIEDYAEEIIRRNGWADGILN